MRRMFGEVYIESEDLYLIESFDPFLKELADICNVLIPLREWEDATNKMELVKKYILQQIKKYKQDSIDYSWTVSPERMGQ